MVDGADRVLDEHEAVSPFAGDGELAELMRATDWAAGPLGPVARWPQSLRTAVSICLSSRFPMWMTWGPQLTVFYNDAYRRDTLGIKHPSALGQPAWDVWWEIWPEIGPRIESVLDSGVATWDESLLLFLERAGYVEETYHTFSYSPLRDDDGRVAGMLCVVTEETDRVLAERRMRVLRELGETPTALAAPGACQAAVAVLARHRDTVPSARVYLRTAAAAGNTDEDAAADADQLLLVASHGVLAGSAVLARREVPRNLDEPLWRVADGLPDTSRGLVGQDEPGCAEPLPLGDAEPVTVLALPLTAPTREKPVGVLVLGVSPYRNLDADYRAFLELVAASIGTAVTDALAYETERRRVAALAELDQAKTKFFSNVSHELRTPLTLITGPVAALRDDPEVRARPQLAAELDLVARNGSRLTKLVNTLLEFSRLQAGRVSARFAPTDLGAVTADLAAVFRAAVERAGLDYRVHIGRFEEPVWVDRSAWERIVLNLLSNALKFTFRGAIRVELAPAADHRSVRLTVADTGIGIPRVELPRLFERFHQVPGARGRSAEGSGIGLALVHDLVELHGGTVEVDSEPGRGTTFTVSVPAGSAHLPADQLVAADQALDADGGPDGGAVAAADPFVTEAIRWLADDRLASSPATGEPEIVRPVDRPGGIDARRARVLVVDDNADMREYLTRLLAAEYEVLGAVNGRAAWEVLTAAREDPPELVVTDVMMPELDGFALLAAVRADPALAAVPVIVVSARAGEEAAVEGLAAGADDYLVKPFTAAELLARVRAHVSMARLRRREGAWRSTLLNTLSDGLFVLDRDGAVIEINQGFTDILGYAADGLPYRPPHPWWPPPRPDLEQPGLEPVVFADMLAAGSGRWSVWLRHHDGRPVRVEISTDVLPAPADELGHVVGVVRDVTEQHRARERDRVLAASARELTESRPVRDHLTAMSTVIAAALGEPVVILRIGPDDTTRVVATADPRQPGRVGAWPSGSTRLPVVVRRSCLTGAAFVSDQRPSELLGLDADEVDPVGAPDGAGPATLVAPLCVAGRLLGLLLVPAVTDGRRFHDDELRMAEELARRMAGLLDVDRSVTRERQLHEVGLRLAAATTAAQAASALADALAESLGANGAAVYVVHPDDPGHLHLERQIGYGAEFAERHPKLSIEDAYLGCRAARTGEAFWLGDEDALRPHPRLAEIRRQGLAGAFVALPLQAGTRNVGVVGLAFATGREFPAEERLFADTLVAQAAQAFDRAAHTDARWRIAQTLQRALLPDTPPPLMRLEVATRYLPAGRDIAAGGDWYDVINLDDHRTALVVGDVVGQGASAAAIMGQLRAALAMTLLQGHRPEQALEHLNVFAARIPGARASTAAVAVIDSAAATVRWACAGHPPPMLLTPGDTTGVARYLETGRGPILGCVAAEGGRPVYTGAETVIEPGCTLLLYTDGLVERRGELIDDGFARAARTVERLSANPPDTVITELLRGCGGGGHPDDIAVLAARFLPPPLHERVPASPESLRPLRRALLGWAAAAALSEDHAYDLQLAASEAIENAVEHAYREGSVVGDTGGGRAAGDGAVGDGAVGDGAAGSIDVRLCRVADGAVRVRVRDYGRWRKPPDDPGFRGRGLQVIRSLAVQAAVDRTDSGTTVTFTVPPPVASPGGGSTASPG